MPINKTSVNDIKPSFAKLDFALICEEEYSNLKQIDWVTYAILKNQEGLSLDSFQKGNKGYVDEKGHVFIKVSQAKLAKLIKLSIPTLRASLKRLEDVKLIECVFVGVNKCNKIYVGNPNRSITFAEYVNEIGIELNEEEYREPIINTTNVNKKASAGTEAKENIKSNDSICESDINNTSNQEENEDVNTVKEATNTEIKLSEVAQAIKTSNVNIKQTDIKECEELFTNIDKLKGSLASMENTNSHGLKALKMAYTKSNNNNNTNKPKTKFHNLKNESFKNYSDEELEEIIQRNQAKKFTPKYKL